MAHGLILSELATILDRIHGDNLIYAVKGCKLGGKNIIVIFILFIHLVFEYYNFCTSDACLLNKD